MGNCMELLLGLANLMVDISDNCSSWSIMIPYSKTHNHIYKILYSTWTFLRSIIFGSFGVWPKMTQFSESRLILLVCLVLLPSGHTITTSDILNMTEHGLHPGCVAGTYQAIFISRAPTHINAHNCAQNYPQNARKNPQNARKRPQIQESGKFV